MAKPARFSPDTVIPRVRTLADEAARAADAEVVEVAFVRESGHLYLKVMVQEPGATRLQTCEKVSRALSRVLDKLNLIPVNYYLEVSSPGIVGPETFPSPPSAAPSVEEDTL